MTQMLLPRLRETRSTLATEGERRCARCFKIVMIDVPMQLLVRQISEDEAEDQLLKVCMSCWRNATSEILYAIVSSASVVAWQKGEVKPDGEDSVAGSTLPIDFRRGDSRGKPKQKD